jgi:carboxymethylenebutenolidase
MRARSFARPAVNFRVSAEWVSFASGRDRIRGYLAVPRGCMLFGAIVTAPEHTGVTAFQQEEARRLAAEGFIVLVTDLHSRMSVARAAYDSMAPEERRMRAYLTAKDETAVADLQAGFDYLASRLDVDTDYIGALGYGLGGGAVLAWSASPNNLACAACLYAAPIVPADYRPDRQPLSRIALAPLMGCPVQLHVGEDDETIPFEQALTFESALESESPQPVEFYTYPGARHAYMDDTGERYSPEAAELTYRRVAAFFRRHLGDWSAA